ncbi:pyrimidine dimer DNA glycosylase [Xanthomonas phage Pfeifenkraut]|uniref:Pyrimidine dimer DNA glycosylase n=1 Tax=Xanthomonas phage Pfeifenkraut TaxID=2939132 RepID=A0A9E7J666_9CAUD|nr:pyrimidine dimer DNA glycosylase [Xanthomonas phage Pfeifenkraut]URA06959.1 pyrimidine dimer DNA glycosylase [Xanthomonas phage Pfeifenkraut]
MTYEANAFLRLENFHLVRVPMPALRAVVLSAKTRGNQSAFSFLAVRLCGSRLGPVSGRKAHPWAWCVLAPASVKRASGRGPASATVAQRCIACMSVRGLPVHQFVNRCDSRFNGSMFCDQHLVQQYDDLCACRIVRRHCHFIPTVTERCGHVICRAMRVVVNDTIPVEVQFNRACEVWVAGSHCTYSNRGGTPLTLAGMRHYAPICKVT